MPTSDSEPPRKTRKIALGPLAQKDVQTVKNNPEVQLMLGYHQRRSTTEDASNAAKILGELIAYRLAVPPTDTCAGIARRVGCKREQVMQQEQWLAHQIRETSRRG